MVLSAFLRQISIWAFVLAGSHAWGNAVLEELRHDGYVESVEDERRAEVARLKLMEKPAHRVSVDLNSRIFTDRLTKEFRERYQQQFGQTEAEQTITNPTRFTYYNGNATSLDGRIAKGTFQGSEEERLEAHRRFGNFMLRRMTEYHVDHYARSKPAVQKVYQVKEKLSDMKLEFNPRVKLKVDYRLSGNTVKLQLINPWLDHDVLVEMDDTFGPSEVKEVVFSVRVPVTTKTSFETYFRILENTLTLIGRRSLEQNLTATFTARSGRVLLEPTDLVPTGPYEQLILAGLSWNY